MSDERKIESLSISDPVEEIQESDINNERKESVDTNGDKDNKGSLKVMEDNAFILVVPEVSNMDNENTEISITDLLENLKKAFIFYPHNKDNKVLNRFTKAGELDKSFIYEYLKNVAEDKLEEFLKEVEQINYYLLMENEVYEFILNENAAVPDPVNRVEVDNDISSQESFMLSYPTKRYFAKKKFEHAEKELELKQAGYTHDLQNLNFELESLNMSLKDLQVSQKKFDKNIRISGLHPVTKRVILQKIVKFFYDSIRTKMALSNRYKIQIQSDIMERNKILSQIKAQEKRLASLDMTEFQKVQFEHKKSCRLLATYKEQLGKFKTKFSPLLQSITDMKKALEKEQNEMEKMKNTVSKLEHLKKVMLSEKSRNDQKVLELRSSMRKIQLDPRRHNLPEVIDYAAAKRENAILVKNISKWQKKVQIVQQEKFLHLNALSKKKKT